jgi:hypothetical protein
MTQTIYRNGSRVAIDIDTPAANGGAATHVRSEYDLTAHTSESWNPANSAGGCGTGTFSGDWGDPFVGLVDVSTGKQTGTETMNGFATKVYAVAADGATAKVWVDTKTGAAGKSCRYPGNGHEDVYRGEEVYGGRAACFGVCAAGQLHSGRRASAAIAARPEYWGRDRQQVGRFCRRGNDDSAGFAGFVLGRDPGDDGGIDEADHHRIQAVRECD